MKRAQARHVGTLRRRSARYPQTRPPLPHGASFIMAANGGVRIVSRQRMAALDSYSFKASPDHAQLEPDAVRRRRAACQDTRSWFPVKNPTANGVLIVGVDAVTDGGGFRPRAASTGSFSSQIGSGRSHRGRGCHWHLHRAILAGQIPRNRIAFNLAVPCKKHGVPTDLCWI